MNDVSPCAGRSELLTLARRLGLGAVVAMSPENFAYVSGVHIVTIRLMPARQGFAILLAEGEPELVICSTEKPLAESEGWIRNIRAYTEFVQHPVDALAARLRELRIEPARIGIDMDYLPASGYERLRKQLADVQLVDTSGDIAAIRLFKTRAEITLIERATRGTHRAALDAMQASQLGDTEQEMCQRIGEGILRSGATGIAFLCFASGERTRIPSAMATTRVPAESEIIRFDVGGNYRAYQSDFARTYSTGNPTAEQRQTYAALLRVQRATIYAVGPGMAAEDLFHLCREAFRSEGIPFTMSHIGHSFGVELHERPMLRPGEKTKLRAGMVLNIEPNTCDGSGSKYHIEDLVEVTKTGCRLMTLGFAPPDIPVIGQDLGYA